MTVQSLRSVLKRQVRPTSLFAAPVQEVQMEGEQLTSSNPQASYIQAPSINQKQQQFLNKYLETALGSRRPITSQIVCRRDSFQDQKSKSKSVSRAFSPSNLQLTPSSYASYTQRMQIFRSKLDQEKMQSQKWQAPDSGLAKNQTPIVYSKPLTPQTILMTHTIENKRQQTRFSVLSNNVRPITSFNLTWQKRNQRNIDNTIQRLQQQRFSSCEQDQFCQSQILKEMLGQSQKNTPVPLEIYIEPIQGAEKAIETQQNEESKMSYLPKQLRDSDIKQPDMFTSFDDATLSATFSSNPKSLKRERRQNQHVLNSTQRIATELQQINKLKLFTLLKTSNGPELTPDKADVPSPQKDMPYFKKKAQYLKLLNKPMFIAQACKSPNNFSSVPPRTINRRGCQALSEQYVGASIDDYIKAKKVLQYKQLDANRNLNCSRAFFSEKFQTCPHKEPEPKQQKSQKSQNTQKSQDSQTELIQKKSVSSTIVAQENELKSSRMSIEIKKNVSGAVSDYDELNSATLLEQIREASKLLKSPAPKAKQEMYLVKKMKAFDIPLDSSRSENKGFRTKKSSFLNQHASSQHSKEPNSDENLLKVTSQVKNQKPPQRVSLLQLQRQELECDSKDHSSAEVKNTEIVIKQLENTRMTVDECPSILVTKTVSEPEQSTARKVEDKTFLKVEFSFTKSPREQEGVTTQRDRRSVSLNSTFHLDPNIDLVKNVVITSTIHHEPKQKGGQVVKKGKVAREMISPTQIQVLEDISHVRFVYQQSDRYQSQPKSSVKYALFQKQRGKNISK